MTLFVTSFWSTIDHTCLYLHNKVKRYITKITWNQASQSINISGLPYRLIPSKGVKTAVKFNPRGHRDPWLQIMNWKLFRCVCEHGAIWSHAASVTSLSKLEHPAYVRAVHIISERLSFAHTKLPHQISHLETISINVTLVRKDSIFYKIVLKIPNQKNRRYLL